MMDTAKKELSQILLLLAVILGGVVVFQWLLVNDLCSPKLLCFITPGEDIAQSDDDQVYLCTGNYRPCVFIP